MAGLLADYGVTAVFGVARRADFAAYYGILDGEPYQAYSHEG